MGKLTPEELKKLLNCIERDSKVIVPPSPGFDSGVHKIRGKYLVVSTDPCLDVPLQWFGWFLTHYAASDVALFGATPEFCTLNLLGPAGTDAEVFLKIMAQACKACKELGITIVTGHTGTYKSLSTMTGTCTAYGTVTLNKLRTPADAKAGDSIICTKRLGMEIVVNLWLAHRKVAQQMFHKSRAKVLSKLVKLQSCVTDALALSKISEVHAMHDATEGGLVAALNEMAEASKLGFNIDYDKIPFADETHILQQYFGLSDLQRLSMSSTGTILAAVNPRAEKEVKKVMCGLGIETSVLGTFSKNQKRLLMKNGARLEFPQKPDDPYEEIISRCTYAP